MGTWVEVVAACGCGVWAVTSVAYGVRRARAACGVRRVARRHGGTAARRHGGTAARRHGGTAAGQTAGGEAAAGQRRDNGRPITRLHDRQELRLNPGEDADALVQQCRRDHHRRRAAEQVLEGGLAGVDAAAADHRNVGPQLLPQLAHIAQRDGRDGGPAEPAIRARVEGGSLRIDVDEQAVADGVDGSDKADVRARVDRGGGALVLLLVEVRRRLDADDDTLARGAVGEDLLMDAGAKWEPSEHSGGEGCGKVPGSVLGPLRRGTRACPRSRKRLAASQLCWGTRG